MESINRDIASYRENRLSSEERGFFHRMVDRPESVYIPGNIVCVHFLNTLNCCPSCQAMVRVRNDNDVFACGLTYHRDDFCFNVRMMKIVIEK